MSSRNRFAHVNEFHNHDIDPSTRTIYIPGGGSSAIDEESAERAIKNLLILDSIGSNKPINIILNSIGGDLYQATAIYDSIKACVSPVNVVVLGAAMSAAAVILQAGDLRLVSPSSRVMIHLGEQNVQGHPRITEAWMKDYKKLERWMISTLFNQMRKKNRKLTMKSVEDLLIHDTIFDAKEAVAVGLADEIIGQDVKKVADNE